MEDGVRVQSPFSRSPLTLDKLLDLPLSQPPFLGKGTGRFIGFLGRTNYHVIGAKCFPQRLRQHQPLWLSSLQTCGSRDPPVEEGQKRGSQSLS